MVDLKIAALITLCAALAGCGSLSTVGLDSGNLTAAKRLDGNNLQQKVDFLAQPLIDGGQVPGMVVGVLLPDRSRQFFGYGVADKTSGIKPDGDTLFAVGSLSKLFLGAITAKLVDDGVLSWDETLRTLLPATTPLSPDAEKITVLQLATHTSGLPRQPMTFAMLSPFVRYLFTGENFYRHLDRDYAMAYLAGFEADTSGVPHYSNIGYGLLGYILELRTGSSLGMLLQQKIIAPLGLKCTGYAPVALPCYSSRAHGYSGDQPKFIRRGEAVPDWEFTPFMQGAGAIYSNARDILSFAAAHVWDTDLPLNAVMADDMRVRFPRVKEAAAISWVVDEVEGEPIAYQIGVVAGYTAYVGIDIGHKTAVVVLKNSFEWDNRIGHQLLLSLRRQAR
ncbi:serine hydrolase domain-containing protein [Herbaspirillum sp. RTI4]|uniref:serine hydrolase domain-containing protein n=1 Tax=Herbaspirillum sp. RTI4 TaxID=3048640 RepID=UPI002AB55152|nr:serine hydrolase domain-containing protein [Herbaspirillum sp. RTI4]MDY7579797.1 serine hydrolase domain-containing protein [Herbaspirillum sp. RTI4]MEA9982598.1 serine hydrolase domain-containing protein [Herbaspirillum sp. RTI4]